MEKGEIKYELISKNNFKNLINIRRLSTRMLIINIYFFPLKALKMDKK